VSDYKFEKELCWYKDICTDFNTEACRNGCLRHLEMFYLMNNALIPEKLQKVHKVTPSTEDLEAFRLLADIKTNILDFVESGKSLYLFSENCGNGKTTWAIKLLQSYFDKIWYGNRFKTRGLFVNLSTFLIDLRKSIAKRGESDENIEELIYDVDLVIWDDIGSGNLKDFDFLNIMGILDYRISRGLSNIYTSNLTEPKLLEALGQKLFSRIYNYSVKVELKGLDRRRVC